MCRCSKAKRLKELRRRQLKRNQEMKLKALRKAERQRRAQIV
jgi:hypothetical protein